MSSAHDKCPTKGPSRRSFTPESDVRLSPNAAILLSASLTCEKTDDCGEELRSRQGDSSDPRAPIKVSALTTYSDFRSMLFQCASSGTPHPRSINNTICKGLFSGPARRTACCEPAMLITSTKFTTNNQHHRLLGPPRRTGFPTNQSMASFSHSRGDLLLALMNIQCVAPIKVTEDTGGDPMISPHDAQEQCTHDRYTNESNRFMGGMHTS